MEAALRNLRLVPLGLAVLCLGQAATSKPDPRKLAEDLLALSNAEKNLSNIRAQFGQMITAQLRSMKVPDEMRGRMEAHQQQLLDVVFEEFSFEKMKPDYVEAYTATFTTDELAGLVEFYKSPTGRAFADKLPDLTKRLMDISQAKVPAVLPRLQKMNADFIADLKKAASPP